MNASIFFVLLLVGCDGGESITDPGGTDPGSEEPPNEQVEELESQEGASWTLLQVDVGTESEESRSVQAIIDEDREVDATLSPDGTLYFLIPDLETGDYSVRFTEGENTWEFDLTVRESEENSSDETAREIVDELDSSGSEPTDAEEVLSEIESLEPEEQAKAEVFLSQNQSLVQELMDVLGESEVQSLSRLQERPQMVNVDEDVWVRTLAALEAASEAMTKMASLRESVEATPGIELALEFVDRVVESLLPVVDQLASATMESPIVYQGEGIRVESSTTGPPLSLTWETSDESLESWDAVTGESYRMQVEPLNFRTVRDSDIGHESSVVRSLVESYEAFRAGAAELYDESFDAYSEESDQVWPKIDEELILSMGTDDLELDISEVEPGLVEMTILPTDYQTELEQLETTLQFSLQLKDQSFELSVPVDVEVDPESIPEAPEFSRGWTVVDPALGSDPIHELVDIDFRDEMHGWAVGYDGSTDDGEGVAIYSNDRGRTWERDFDTETGENYRPVQVEYLSTGRAIAVTRNGVLLSRFDEESQWSVSDIASDLPFSGDVRFWTLETQDEDRWWLAGALVEGSDETQYTPILLRTDDGGESWSVVLDLSGEETGRFYSVFFLDEEVGWAAGPDNGVIYRTTDGGINWEKLTLEEFPEQMTHVTATRERVWLSGMDGYTARSEDGGESWYVNWFNQEDIEMIRFLDAIRGTGWMVGPSGVRESDVGGSIWNPVNRGLLGLGRPYDGYFTSIHVEEHGSVWFTGVRWSPEGGGGILVHRGFEVE
ncbi:MAG: YCF48-related protein [Balneolaceae bacterium]